MNEIEKALPLAEAARRWLPPSRTGNPIRPSVLWRWAEYGLRVGDRRVRLQVTRVGGQRYVTKESLQKFLDALNPETPEEVVSRESEPPQTNESSKARAEKLCETAMAVL